MKKLFITLFLLTIILNSFSQQYKTAFQEHREKAKNAYRLNADEENHKKIREEKEAKSFEVGDTKIFWKWDFAVMPPTWIQEPATCRAAGELSYIFIADNQWNVNMDQEDVDLSMSFLEDSTLNTTEYGIVAMDTIFFGTIPDEIDNDPKVIFFYSALGEYNGSIFDGYFSEFNQMTEAEAQATGDHSNECEMLYMSCDPVNPTAILTLSVLAHELQHLIHWGADPDEETWLNEGCSELAMVLFGQPDPISSFPGNTNNNLLSWDQQFSDYVQTMLFFTYLYERFGAKFIKDIVANTNHSVESINEELVNNTIDSTFADIFSDWTLANFIDDPTFDEGQYGYELLDLPGFSYVQKNEYPINVSSDMNNCANRYYKFSKNFLSLDLEFLSDDIEHFDINILCFDENDNILEIVPHTDYEIDYEYLEGLDKIIFNVINNYAAFGEDDYSFTVDALVSVNETKKQNNDLLSVFPNPINTKSKIKINLSSQESVQVQLFDNNGKLIETIFSGELTAGTHYFSIKSQNLDKGIYFVKMINNKNVYSEKCVIFY